MPIEIERKFLVKQDSWKPINKGQYYRQAYLSDDTNGIVRIRVAGDKGFITIKSKSDGIARKEYEYEIPADDAKEILDSIVIKPQIEKIRYTINYKGSIWEVDEFLGENLGLIIAEIELEHEEQIFYKPDWIAEEVSLDVRYYNSNLVKNPYANWKK